jgi:hypothetical protein
MINKALPAQLDLVADTAESHSSQRSVLAGCGGGYRGPALTELLSQRLLQTGLDLLLSRACLLGFGVWAHLLFKPEWNRRISRSRSNSS